MVKFLLALQFVAVLVTASPLLVDYNCIPNVACTIMLASIAKGGIGLIGIGDTKILGTSALHRSVNATFTCPNSYCKDINDACLEYPFASTKDSAKKTYKCVPIGEMQMLEYQLNSMYATDNISDGGEFYFKVDNIPDIGCMM